MERTFGTSDRSRQHKSETRYSRIFDLLSSAVYVCDRTGVITEYNTAAVRIWGTSPRTGDSEKHFLASLGIFTPDRHRLSFDKFPSSMALDTGEPVRGIELVLQRPDESQTSVLVDSYPVKNSFGEIETVVTCMTDISERKLIEDEKNLLMTLTHVIAEAHDFHEALNVTLRVVCESSGWELGELWTVSGSKTHLEFGAAYASDKSAEIERFRKTSERYRFDAGSGIPGRVWETESVEFIRDLSVYPEFTRAAIAMDTGFTCAVGIPVFADEDLVAVIVFFMRDIRKADEKRITLISTIAAHLGKMIRRKRVEEELLKRENYIRQRDAALNAASHAIVITDRDGKLEWVNPAYTTLTGYAREEVIGKNFRDLQRSGEQSPEFYTELWNIITSGRVWQGELINRRKNGSLYTEEQSITPVKDQTGAITHFISIKQDVTERKKSEEKLQIQTDELRERVKELNCIFEITKLLYQGNREQETILRQVPSILVRGFQHPDSTCARVTYDGHTYVSGRFTESATRIGVDIKPGNRRRGRIEVFYTGEKLPEGSDPFLREERRLIENVVEHLAGYFERMETEEELGKIYKLLQETQEMSKVGGWEYDIPSGKISWTDEVYRIYGVDRTINLEDVDTLLDFYTPESGIIIYKAFEKAVRYGEPFDLELEFIRADGRHIWVRTVGKSILRDGKPSRVLGNIMDITQRKDLEQQIVRVQKLESIGQLAGGVAHDLNNVLGAILGHADLGRRKLPSETPLYKRFDKILNLTERGSRIIQQLLAFSRRQKIEPRNTNLNSLISDLLKLLGKTLGAQLEIEFNPGSDIRTVLVDPGQMDQVILNLCINARDAMPRGGNLVISTRSIEIDDANKSLHIDAKTGTYVVISVSDNGTGIAPEDLDRIFDPFYTTKEVGKGTGLGLSVVHGIVGLHQGFIDVHSEPGIGTTFNIYLPAVDGEPETDMIREVREIPRGTNTLLVVEDDEDILTMVQILLENQGYTVLSARDGNEGYKLFQAEAGRIDLIISDVVMPKFSGREFYERVQAVKAGVPFLFISGYTADIISKHFIIEEGVDFIAKPFSPIDFGEKIREILNR